MHITVRDLMTRSPVVVSDQATLREALTRLLDESAPEIYVADSSGQFLGSVPDYELLKAQLDGSADVRDVCAVMSRSVIHVEPEMPISEVAGRFRDGRHRRLPVVEEGHIVGQIDRRDVMRLMCALETLDEPAAVADSTGTGHRSESPIRSPRFAQPRHHDRATTWGH